MKWFGCIVLLFGLAVARRGQATSLPAATAEAHCRTGLEQQAQAEMAVTKAAARQFYTAAIAEYQAAAQIQTNHYQSQWLWATCLTQLVPLATTAEECQRFARQAAERFTIASRCPGATAAVFEQWASLLVGTTYGLTADRRQQEILLQQTVEICQRGLRLATEPTPRAQLERRLGSALMWMVDFTSDPVEKRTLLERGIEHLRDANQVVTVRQTLYQNGYLGIALLSLGRLIDDPARLGEAAAEFEAALTLYPNQYDTHYNLAATYSLLGDAERAGRHLAVTIDHDPDGGFARMAERDRDLERVRGTPAYAAALDRRRRRLAEASARGFFVQAFQAQENARKTNDTAAATALLTQAVGWYGQAIEAMPDHVQAQALCATALVRLGELHRRDPDQQRRDFEAARQRFAAAAQCPGVQAQLYSEWASFLLGGYYPLLKNHGDQERALQEARLVLEEGIRLARFSGLRARLESQSGTCLVLLARLQAALPPAADPAAVKTATAVPSPASQSPATNTTALLTEAVRHFQTAASAGPGSRSAEFYEFWGVALLGAGKALRDPLLIRQATERLLESLALAADNPAVHYNLACAYAQSLQSDQAMRHLQLSIENDPRGLFYTNAETDPDLEPLRRTEAFRRLFHQQRPVGTGDHPTVSEK